MRGVCQKSPYRRSPNPNPINTLTFSSANLPASPPAAPIIPPSRRTGGSLGRRSAAAAGADGAGATRSRIPKGSLAEGMRSRAGWKAGRPRGRGGDPHRSRRWSLPSLPAVCRRTPRQQRGPRSAHVEACPRGASDVRRNGIFSTHRASARRSAHAPQPSPDRRAGLQPACWSAGRMVLTILPVSRAEPSSARSRRVAARLNGPPRARLTASMPTSPASGSRASR